MILLQSVVIFNAMEYTLVCAQQYGDDQVPMYGTLNLHINGFINYWTCPEQLLFYRQDLFTKYFLSKFAKYGYTLVQTKHMAHQHAVNSIP